MTVEKQVFLVCYEHGMGDLWGTFIARSEQEINDLYPERLVVRKRPKWMTDEDFQSLVVDRELHDIDGAPWRILNTIIADRDRQRVASRRIRGDPCRVARGAACG